MAETEPKTAKHKANAPVPRTSCSVLERSGPEFMRYPKTTSLRTGHDPHVTKITLDVVFRTLMQTLLFGVP